MATYDKALADFVARFGEDAVPVALNAYIASRERSRAYAEKQKRDRALYHAIVSAAKDPTVAQKLAALGIKV